jgi:hypothetical protein
MQVTLHSHFSYLALSYLAQPGNPDVNPLRSDLSLRPSIIASHSSYPDKDLTLFGLERGRKKEERREEEKEKGKSQPGSLTSRLPCKPHLSYLA